MRDVANRAINDRRAITMYMYTERLHPVIKNGNLIEVYNNVIYYMCKCYILRELQPRYG